MPGCVEYMSIVGDLEGGMDMNGKQRAWLADRQEGQLKRFREALEADGCFEVLGVSTDGLDAWRAIQREQPDVAIFNLILPRLDGLSLLRRLKDAQYPTRAIVLSSVAPDDLVMEALALGAEYFCARPMDDVTIVRRIKTCLALENRLPQTTGQLEAHERRELEVAIAQWLHKLGVPPHIKGYHYLIEGILFLVLDMDWLNAMTAKVYPGIAAKFGTTPSRVERAIRHAIEVTWNRGQVESIEQVFGETLDDRKDKPTNSEFMAMIADHVRVALPNRGRTYLWPFLNRNG